MVLRIYNSMGRRKMVFRPLRGKSIRMYTCGPTVWNYAGIHNFRTFVFEDVLRRYLKFKGYKVTQVKNITDVEDRIIRGIKLFNKSRVELTDFFEKAFMEDASTLNIERAEFYPRATDHIPAMVVLIKKLMKRGYAYKAEDGSVYFRVSKFKRYGRLSGIKTHELKAAGRVSADHYDEKKVANDFALWKAWDPDDGDVFWETELGKGRPGWHIECSTMSMKYLGKSFDIHTGGMDLRFPHHENEIAQSESATGKTFVKYWIHPQFLTLKGEEMHKSKGNVVTLRDLVKEGRNPKAVRLFLISSKYRLTLDLTPAQLDQAEAQRQRLQDFLSRLREVRNGAGGELLAGRLAAAFESAMDDDLNTPRAIAAIFTIAKEANALIDRGKLGSKAAVELISALTRVDSVLGVIDFHEEGLPSELAELIQSRSDARRRGDYATADRLRGQLLEKGVVVEDTPKGPVWKRRASS